MIRGLTYHTKTGTQRLLRSKYTLTNLLRRLLRNTPHDQPVLFLYRNFPCVVIGRNQVRVYLSYF